MRFSNIVNLGLIAAGAAASLPTLRRRHTWEQTNQRAFIVLDYDDAQTVSTRAALPLADFLSQAREHGATHVSLPELTLERLLRLGRLAPVIPARAQQLLEDDGRRWTYLGSTDGALLEYLAQELTARAPFSEPQLLPRSAGRSAATPYHTLALNGHLPALAEMGLGFDAAAAAEALSSGLGLAPRPVSFAWPEAHLVERTLAQAAELKADVIAFDGDLILGHEMHLDAAIESMLRLGLTFAYFCETRHQKGDWFMAKRLAPAGQVMLAHYFTPAAMVPEDFHSAAHHWGMLARARGIRLCYVNVFRRIHATSPLECLHYLEHIRGELEGQGLRFDAQSSVPLAAPDRRTMAVAGLASAGAASLAASQTLRLPEPAALALAGIAAAGALAIPYLDRPRGQLEQAYPPSYAPKLLGLAGAASAPAAAALSGDLLTAAVVQAGSAAALALHTSGADYQMRIEEYRSLNLDLALPLAAVLLRGLDDPRLRALSLAALSVGWFAARKLAPDVLGAMDKDLPAGHTHHLSAAQRAMGDALIALGPRPGRKWAGLGFAGMAAAVWLRRMGRKDLALAASLASVAANALGLAAFRRPERPLAQTVVGVARSNAWGALAGALALLLPGARGDTVVPPGE